MYALQPEKKSNGCVTALAVIGVIALAVVGLFVVAVFAVSSGSGGVSGSSTTRQIVYKVRTDRDSSIYPSCYWFDATYEMPSGTAQRPASICDGAYTGVVDQRSAQRGDFVYLSVQNDKYYAGISCEIHIDGKLVYQTQSAGQYVIASCSGTVP